MIQALYNRWQGRGVAVYTISGDRDMPLVEEFMKDRGLTFAVLFDEKQETLRTYQIRFYPTTFFIDRDGIIRDKVIGAFESLGSIESRLTKILR